MDASDAQLIMTVPLQTDEQVTAWFELLADAHAGTTTLPAFADTVRGAATWCDPEPFLRALADAGEDLAPVTRILEVRAAMPGYYWELCQQWYGEPDQFGWVAAEQAAALTAAWGANWRTHLGPQLDYHWGAGWEANPADHKQYWLAGLLPQLLEPEPTATPEPAAPDMAAPTEVTPAEVTAMPGGMSDTPSTYPAAVNPATTDPAAAHSTAADPATTEPAAVDPATVDLDELAAQMVAETLAELDAELSDEELAEVTATVRNNLREAMKGE